MKTMISAIFAASALLVGASSFADKAVPQPPPQYDQDGCGQEECGPVQQAPPQAAPVDNDYYGPGQAGLYGYYDVSCIPDFDEDLYYRCDYDDFAACQPIVDPDAIYGVLYPYPRPGFVITPVFAQRYWSYYGPRGLIGIYRGGYHGQYMPRVVRQFAPNMIPRGYDPRLRGGFAGGVDPRLRGGFVGGGVDPRFVRGGAPAGAMVPRGVPPGVIVNQGPNGRVPMAPPMGVMSGGRPMVGAPGVGPRPIFRR